MELGKNIGNWGEGHIYYYFLKKLGQYGMQILKEMSNE